MYIANDVRPTLKYFWALNGDCKTFGYQQVQVFTISSVFQISPEHSNFSVICYSMADHRPVGVGIKVFSMPTTVFPSTRHCTAVAPGIQVGQSYKMLLNGTSSLPITICRIKAEELLQYLSTKICSEQLFLCICCAIFLVERFCRFHWWHRRETSVVLYTYPFSCVCKPIMSLHVLHHDKSSSSLPLPFCRSRCCRIATFFSFQSLLQIKG